MIRRKLLKLPLTFACLDKELQNFIDLLSHPSGNLQILQRGGRIFRLCEEKTQGKS